MLFLLRAVCSDQPAFILPHFVVEDHIRQLCIYIINNLNYFSPFNTNKRIKNNNSLFISSVHISSSVEVTSTFVYLHPHREVQTSVLPNWPPSFAITGSNTFTKLPGSDARASNSKPCSVTTPAFHLIV